MSFWDENNAVSPGEMTEGRECDDDVDFWDSQINDHEYNDEGEWVPVPDD